MAMVDQFGNAAPYVDIVKAAAAKYDIPTEILFGMVEQESGWNPNAVSKAGAKGLAQLMPATAKELGVLDRADPAQSIEGGARYLRQQYDRFKNWGDALTAYHSGAGRVQKVKQGRSKLGPVGAAYASDVTRRANKFAQLLGEQTQVAQAPSAPEVAKEPSFRDKFTNAISGGRFGAGLRAVPAKTKPQAAIPTQQGIALSETPEEETIMASAVNKGYSPLQQEQLVTAMQSLIPARDLITQKKPMISGAGMPDELDGIISQLIAKV